MANKLKIADLRMLCGIPQHDRSISKHALVQLVYSTPIRDDEFISACDKWFSLSGRDRAVAKYTTKLINSCRGSRCLNTIGSYFDAFLTPACLGEFLEAELIKAALAIPEIGRIFESDDKPCAVCCINQRTHLLVPCGHRAFCKSCAKNATTHVLTYYNEFEERPPGAPCAICNETANDYFKMNRTSDVVNALSGVHISALFVELKQNSCIMSAIDSFIDISLRFNNTVMDTQPLNPKPNQRITLKFDTPASLVHYHTNKCMICKSVVSINISHDPEKSERVLLYSSIEEMREGIEKEGMDLHSTVSGTITFGSPF